MSSHKRVILVTGANQGVGYELVRQLAKEGQTVYLGARSDANGQEAIEKLKKEDGVDAKFIKIDVTDEASVNAAKEHIEKTEGKLHVLINNAGISGSMDEVDLIKADNDLSQVFEVNVYGLIRVTHTFLPLIRKTAAEGEGLSSIINVTSIAGSNATFSGPKDGADFAKSGINTSSPLMLPRAIGYRMSKAGVNTYTIALATKLKEEGIRVNAITPGLTATRFSGMRGTPVDEACKVFIPFALMEPADKRTGLYLGVQGEIPW